MFKASDTTSSNANLNQYLLENSGFPTAEASIVVAAITALSSRYRLEPQDALIALKLLRAGTALSTIATTLRPL